MVARRTNHIKARHASYQTRAHADESTGVHESSDQAVAFADDASGRKLRNRILLLNAAAWIVIIAAIRVIFF